MKAKRKMIWLGAVISCIALITACKKKDDVGNLTTLVITPPPPAEFNGNVNGTAITFTTYSYRSDTSSSSINAGSNAGSLNFFMDTPLKEGSYVIDDFSNRAWFNSGGTLVRGETGTLNITKMENDLITGNFSFSTASSRIAGSFVSIPKK